MKKNNTYIINTLFFICSPLIATIYALIKRNGNDKYFILFLFTAWFSFVINPQGEEQDLYRYMDSLFNLRANSVSEIFQMYITGQLEDSFIPFIQLLVSQFTTNGHILLLVCGIILGLFYTLSIKLFPNDKSLYTISLVFIFSFIVGLDRLGGIRNIIGFYLFFWSISSFFRTNNYWYILGGIFACTIHFSYIIYLLIFFLSKIIGNKKCIFYVAIASFFLSFFITKLNVGNFSAFLGEAISFKASEYTHGTIAENLTKGLQNVNWYVRYEIPMLRYGFMVLIIFIYRLIKRGKQDSNVGLLSFIFLMIIFSNLMLSIPNLNGWIIMVTYSFVIYYLSTIIHSLNNIMKKRLILVALFFSVLHIAYTVRQITYICYLSDLILPIFVEL